MTVEQEQLNHEDEILELFLEESKEHLDGIEEDLLSIEKAGENTDDEQVDKVFRAMHTIKGGAGFFGLSKVKDLTHAAENMLDLIRKKQLIPCKEVVQCLFSTVDLLNEMFNNSSEIEQFEVKDVVISINRTISESIVSEDPSAAPFKIKDRQGNTVFEVSPETLLNSAENIKGGDNFYLLRYEVESESTGYERLSSLQNFSFIIDSKMEGGDSLSFYVLVSTIVEIDLAADFFEVEENDLTVIDSEGQTLDMDVQETAEIIIEEDELDDISRALEVANEECRLTDENSEKEDIKSVAQSVKQTAAAPQKSPAKTENLRVNVQLLENLMTIAGELVLARNQLVQALSVDDRETVKISSHQIDMVTSQLQEAVMKTRMQPIGKTFSKFNRIVRDLSSDLGKNVDLIIEGENVEIDKSIIESINDPLTHIVRNSMDHGLETPAERRLAGKPEQGKLEIKAYHETGKVIIEIVDDGRGIDPEKVGRKAVEKELITQSTMQNMSEKELLNLIFKPGFSTNDQVTEISGRGVGMDVVLTNLNKLGGVVELNSKTGSGTRLKISLPLTLAIMPSLLVSACETIYAIPQVNLVQIVRIPVCDISKEVQHIGDSLVIRFLDRLIPVVRAEDFLEKEVKAVPFKEENLGFSKPLHVVVVAAGEFQYGIIVEQTLESPEIVVKALGRNLNSLNIYSGATILGDGTIAPIMDIQGIMNEMNLQHVEQSNHELSSENEVRKSDFQQLLIVNNGHDEDFALLMKSVLRVERIEHKAIVQIGSTRSCEIDGKSIGLFTIDDAADVKPITLEGNLSVIIFEVMGRQVGLITKEIVDSLEIQVEFEEFPHKQPGIFGSTYINNRLCLLVDFFTLVASQKPHWLEKSDIISESKNNDYNILVVDDSVFFLNQISSFLEEAGYSVVKAENGAEALKKLNDKRNKIQMVLTDIEMPVMDGWDLIKNIREDKSLNWLPVVAVTSVSGSEAEKKGKKLGADEYLIKLDREEIILTLHKYLNKEKIAIAG